MNGRLRIRSPSQADPHCKYFWRDFFSLWGGSYRITIVDNLGQALKAICVAIQFSCWQFWPWHESQIHGWFHLVDGRLCWRRGGGLLLHLFGTAAPNRSGSGESLTRQMHVLACFSSECHIMFSFVKMRCRHNSSSSEASDSFRY